MTFDLEEALALRDIVKRTGKVFVLTHNYIGYPIVKEARELVAYFTPLRFWPAKRMTSTFECMAIKLLWNGIKKTLAT
jgi:hypothetical protein